MKPSPKFIQLVLKTIYVKARRMFARPGDGSIKISYRGRKVAFDDAFYRKRYADVGSAGVDPFKHFVLFGALEGRFPNSAEEARITADEEAAFQQRRFVAADTVMPHSFGAIADRYRTSGLPVILLVSHGLGGGTQRYINELTDYFSGQAHFLVLEPLNGKSWDTQTNRKIVLYPAAEDEYCHLIVDTYDDYSHLLKILRSFGIARVSLQHFLYVNLDLKRLIDALNVPFDFTVHDYFSICPYVNLTTPDARYCGEPDIAACNRCIAQRPVHGARDIIWWRKSFEWVFRDADRVICPSEDTAIRLSRYFDSANLKVVHHDPLLAEMPLERDVRATNVTAGEPFRVAVLGVLAPHKGAHVVAACAKLAKAQDQSIEFHVIGASQISLPLAPEAPLFETGAYAEGEAEKFLGEVDPHLIWFPAQWPETYSYTLSEALAAGLPVVASGIGAFPERLQGRPWTWTVNWNASPDEILSLFQSIRREHFLTATAPPVPNAVTREISNFYKDEFLAFSERGYMIDLRKAERLSIVAVLQESLTRFPGAINGTPDACGYIRGLLPLKALAASGGFEFNVVAEARVTDYVADIFFAQRTAIGNADRANEIVAHCRKVGMKIVYDIDDDLFSLEAGHSEFANYKGTLAGALELMTQADLVMVSTNQLKLHLEKWNENIEVVENALDDDIWHIDDVKPLVSRGTQSDPIRILYMGTMSHGADFQMIEGPVRRLCDEFGERIEFEVIGVALPRDLPDWCRRVEVSPEIGQSYPAFVNWLQSENRWHIGVAPLVDTKFNRAKSGIKYLDYAALGLAVACSDIHGYRDVIHSEDDGLLVENTEEAWYEALRRLVCDNDFRQRLQANAIQNLRRRYLLGSVLNTRHSTINAMLQGNRAPIPEWHRVFGDQPKIEPTREAIANRFLSGQGLEIGALQNPLAVPDRVSVKYVDRFPKEKLYEHYPELREFNLVDVDFVDNGETLSTIPDDSQQFVIANHFLEHCENPLGALRNLTRVLRAGGVLYAAIPDRRHTFDRNRKRTPLDHLIEDYESDGSSSRRSHFLEWVRDVEPEFGRRYGSDEEMQARADALEQMKYSIHYHVWESDDVWAFLNYAVEHLKLRAFIEYFGELPEEILFVLRKQ